MASLPCWLVVHATLVLTTVISCVYCQNDVTDVYVTERQDKMLECQFDPHISSRNTVYYWIRANKEEQDNVAIGDQSLVNHYRVELHKNEGRYRLYISNTSYVNDNGRFQCKIKESGTGMDLHVQVFKLIVLITPGPPEIKPSAITATEGKSFQVVCSSVGGSPDPDIQWFREGRTTPLEGSLQPGGSKDKPTINILTFDPKKEDDGVRFTCVVSNMALEQNQTPKLEAFFEMQVNYIPRISIQPRNPLRVERETLTSATCRVDSKPEPISIKWSHNGRIVSNGANLSIRPSSVEDAGTYVCSAENGLGVPGQAELVVDMLYGPSIHMESKRDAEENEDVIVRCNVSANPPAEIHWFKEGDPSFTINGPILRLEKINSKSMGRYTCEAINEMSTSLNDGPVRRVANATVSIWIKHRPGNTVIFPENAVGVEGKSAFLTCVANPPGWPEPMYKWWKDEQRNSLPSGMNYTISKVTTSHEGMYYCQAYNDLGEGNVASIEFKVYESPTLLTSLKPQIIKRTSDAGITLTCEARAKPHPSVRWLKNGHLIDPSKSLEISTTDSKDGNVKSMLKFFGPDRPNFNQLTIDDGGTYVCEFDNVVVDPISSNTTLKIEHGPILRHTERKVAFDIMAPASLECRMQAFPSPSFEWSFQNTIITSGSQQYHINQTDLGNDLYLSTLIIPQVRETDYGEYTCSASNVIDVAKTHIRLVPRGPPEPPTDLKVVNITHNSMILQWTNSFNGGYADTIYLISYWAAGLPEYKNECYKTDCFIGDLQEMTRYSFQVQARNEKGISDSSNEITAETKIDISNIPRPRAVYFNKDNLELYFMIYPTKLSLVGKVEALVDGEWIEYLNSVPIVNTEAKMRVEFSPQTSVKVSLCLKNDTHLCGETMFAVSGSPPSLIHATAGLSATSVITIIICCVVGALFIFVGIVIYCCCCKRIYKEKQMKKDYEMEAANARPKTITTPYYPEGIVNKGVDNSIDHDDTNKNPQYGTRIPMGNNPPGLDRPPPVQHMPNGNMPPGYSYMDREFNNSNGGSVDSQDSIWLKTNGDVPNDRAYPYDTSLNNAYLYPDDYHHMHEDMMNQRNREHLYNGDPYGPLNKVKKRNDHMDVYHDVSEIPDPYMEEEEKVPHNSISFDESLESGYSTPNSRSRRVIREIIV